jgi:hypothetical protein
VKRWTVTYGDAFLRAVAAFVSDEHTSDKFGLSFGAFMAGPVRAARLLFESQWDELPPGAGDAVRVAHTFSQTLGPVVFYGVLVGPRTVEIASFDIDLDYWDMTAGYPED